MTKTDSAWTPPQGQSLRTPFNRTGLRVAGVFHGIDRVSFLQAALHAIGSNGARALKSRPRPLNGLDTDFSPESRDPDSDSVCSACVRKFQMRDSETRAARKI